MSELLGTGAPCTTLAFARGLSLQTVLEGLQARSVSKQPSLLPEVDPSIAVVDGQPCRPCLLAHEAGWTSWIEPSGSVGVSPAIALRLSEQVYVGLHNSENAHSSFVYAREHRLLRHFEPFAYECSAVGAPLAEEAGLDFGTFQSAVTSQVRLVERLTGLVISHKWLLGTPRYTALVPTDASGE